MPRLAPWALWKTVKHICFSLYFQRWGRPWASLGVPGRPWDVPGQMGVVAEGQCFCHRPHCHLYNDKYYVSVVSLGAFNIIDKIEVFTIPCGLGLPTDIVNSI